MRYKTLTTKEWNAIVRSHGGRNWYTDKCHRNPGTNVRRVCSMVPSSNRTACAEGLRRAGAYVTSSGLYLRGVAFLD